MLNPKKQLSRKTDEEWYRLIMDCRKSGLSDSHFCQANGIPNSSFSTAVKRLRKKSFAIPEVTDVDVYYYLKYLLMKCPTALTSDDGLERLCPWNPECKEALNKLHRQHQKAIFDAM